MLQELSKKAVVMLTCIYNVIFRLHYRPRDLKKSEIIFIPKVGKVLQHVTSYTPINLLSNISALLEKLKITKCCYPKLEFGYGRTYDTKYENR